MPLEDEFRPAIIIGAVLLTLVTLILWGMFTIPDSSVTSFYSSGRVVTQNGPPAIQHGWHVAESILIGIWTVFGALAGTLWGDS